MYSRYTPNASGGFDRRQVPDAVEPRRPAPESALPPPPPPPQPEEEPGWPPGGHDPPPTPPPGSSRPQKPPFPARPGGMRPQMPPQRPSRPPHGSPAFPPPDGTPPNPPGLGTLFGPNGLLGGLLPRGLGMEDLLVLAVLLLSMKQDGATGIELMIAAGLYLWL